MYCPHYSATLFSKICVKRQNISCLIPKNDKTFELFSKCLDCDLGKEVKQLYQNGDYNYDYDVLNIKYEYEKFKKRKIYKKLKKVKIYKKLKRKKIYARRQQIVSCRFK